MTIDVNEMIDERLSRVLTQYRESDNLLGLITEYLKALGNIGAQIDELNEAFNIETSTGNQLTLIGKWLGWPRTHCEGQRLPVFGYPCEGYRINYPVKGYCEGVRYSCAQTPYQSYTFEDDDEYRNWLIVRGAAIVAQQTSNFSYPLLEQTASIIFDDDVIVVRTLPGKITLCLTRYFTEYELSILHLVKEILPLPPGIGVVWAHCDGVPYGYGDGWGDTCTSNYYAIIRDPLLKTPKSELFGYGPDYSGYCEGFYGPGGPDQEN